MLSLKFLTIQLRNESLKRLYCALHANILLDTRHRYFTCFGLLGFQGRPEESGAPSMDSCDVANTGSIFHRIVTTGT